MWGNNGEADIENRIMDRVVGEEGEGGTDGESGMETSTSPYVTLIASGNFLYDLGSSNRNSVTT